MAVRLKRAGENLESLLLYMDLSRFMNAIMHNAQGGTMELNLIKYLPSLLQYLYIVTVCFET